MGSFPSTGSVYKVMKTDTLNQFFQMCQDLVQSYVKSGNRTPRTLEMTKTPLYAKLILKHEDREVVFGYVRLSTGDLYMANPDGSLTSRHVGNILKGDFSQVTPYGFGK